MKIRCKRSKEEHPQGRLMESRDDSQHCSAFFASFLYPFSPNGKETAAGEMDMTVMEALVLSWQWWSYWHPWGTGMVFQRNCVGVRSAIVGKGSTAPTILKNVDIDKECMGILEEVFENMNWIRIRWALQVTSRAVHRNRKRRVYGRVWWAFSRPVWGSDAYRWTRPSRPITAVVWVPCRFTLFSYYQWVIGC